MRQAIGNFAILAAIGFSAISCAATQDDPPVVPRTTVVAPTTVYTTPVYTTPVPTAAPVTSLAIDSAKVDKVVVKGLREQGILGSDAQLLEFAHQICDTLISGSTISGVVQAIVQDGGDQAKTAAVVGIAALAYCPDQRSRL
jgi:hypothetical protein